jgi:8-oxo-dGTP pyrophosphatase MutT (NUDIX family)
MVAMDQAQLPQTKMNSDGQEVTLTWIRSDDLTEFRPFYQVYGIIFNNKGEILLIQEKSKWKIPGGTPEKGETDIETMKRELIEEADVKVSKVLPLGAQRVDYPNNPKKEEGDLYFQLRYVCLADELLPQTPDPDTGIVNPRMFVPAEKVTEYVKWGNTGNAMFADAIKLSEKL